MKTLRRTVLSVLIALSLIPFGYFDGFELIAQHHTITTKWRHPRCYICSPRRHHHA